MSRKWRKLTSQDLECILGEWEDSEDGLDFSDDDDVADPTYNLQQNEHESSDEDPEEPPDLEIGVQAAATPETTSIYNQLSSTATESTLAIASPSTSTSAAPSTSNRVPRTNMIWKSLNINDDQIRFLGSETLPPEKLRLDTPLEVFSYLFSEDIINLIRDQTNLYSVQKDANKPVNVSSQEIRQFIGIVYYMSIVRMPNVKMYWSENITFGRCRSI